MAYIGYTGALGNIQKIDPLTFNSSSTTFDIRVNGLLVAVASSTSLFISVGGVIQEPNVDYTVSGSSIIFSAAPLTGLSFFGIILGSSVNIGTPSDGTVTNVKIGETISVAKGGTGATTADAALTNLGGGAAGKAIFAASTQSTARSQLGASTVGSSVFTAADAAAARSAIGAVDSTTLTTAVDALRDVASYQTSTAYTIALIDRGTSIDTSANITIPANASVAFPIGSVVTITNTSASPITISITTDTLRQAGTTNTGTRTLAQYGVATARKVSTTLWIISGAGLT